MANKVPTEWFDLQVKHGNYLPLQKEATLAEIQMKQQQQHAQQNTIPNIIDSVNVKSELDELQDEFDMEDQFTRQYMQKRMHELKHKADNYKYGKLLEISRDQYVRQVTNADPESFVVLHLYATSSQFCQVINKNLPALADKHPMIKFIKILGSKCIDKYPDQNCPTFIIYKAGKPVSNIVNANKYMKEDVNNLEWLLKQHGVIKAE